MLEIVRLERINMQHAKQAKRLHAEKERLLNLLEQRGYEIDDILRILAERTAAEGGTTPGEGVA